MFDVVTSNGIHDCSILLFVIAERVPAAKKYRNAFETIRQRVVDQISLVPRNTTADATSSLAKDGTSSDRRQSTAQPELPEIGFPFMRSNNNPSFEQFSRIMTEMTGEDFSTALPPGTSASGMHEEQDAAPRDFDFNYASPNQNNLLSQPFDYMLDDALTYAAASNLDGFNL